MPKSSNHLALARQWELLKQIPARAPGITAAELTGRLADAGFKVAKRTVERDLVDLAQQFGLACNDISKPFGWYWLPGSRYNFGSVDLLDAVSLGMAEDVLRQMLPAGMLEPLEPKFRQAAKKLSVLPEHPMVRLRDKLRYVPTSMSFQPPVIREGVFEAIRQALVEEMQVEVRYAPFNARTKELRLHPLSLVQRGPVAYLLASTFDYEDVLLYAIHRFEAVRVTARQIKVPKGYSVDAHLQSGVMDFGEGKPIKLKARLSNELATFLAETPLSKDQALRYRKEAWEISATVRDSWQLHFWILSQGAGIEVLGPKTLRDQICRRLAEAMERYE